MGDFFLDLLNISIAAGWVVLAVALLRLILRKTPKWIVCLMWTTVGLRLAGLFSFESEISLIPSTKIINDPKAAGRMVIQTGFESIDASANEFLDSCFYENVTVPADFFGEVMKICGAIWLIGVLVLSAYSVISYLRLRHRVRVSLHWRDKIYLCDDIDSPFVMGIFRPRIYLPSGMDEQQIFCVLRHEEAHIKRLDPLWKMLGFALLTVYWFNPFMWMAYMLFSRDIEQACDEKAISNLNYGGKQEYSRALLYCGTRRKIFVASPVAFGEVGVEQRVRSVLFYENPDVSKTVTTLILCALLFISLLSTPVDNTVEQISASLKSHTTCKHVVHYEYFHVQDGLIVGECSNYQWPSFHMHESGTMVEISACSDCGKIIDQDIMYDGYRCTKEAEKIFKVE